MLPDDAGGDDRVTAGYVRPREAGRRIRQQTDAVSAVAD
jgi:hypothetical protein